MIQRAFVSRNIDLFVRAYLVYVRPLVEYHSVVWAPYTPYRILKLLKKYRDNSQKNLPGLRKFTSKERLRRLHLPSLELRRLHPDLVWCCKIFGIEKTPTEDFYVPICMLQREVTSTNYCKTLNFGHP